MSKVNTDFTVQELAEVEEKSSKVNDDVFDKDITIEALLAAVDRAERDFFVKQNRETMFDATISSQELLQAAIEGEKTMEERMKKYAPLFDSSISTQELLETVNAAETSFQDRILHEVLSEL